MSSRFHFDIPCDAFFKAAPDGKGRRIGGICTTDDMDRQDEVVLQEGLDFSPFLKGGWFNDNHAEDTDGVVGFPTRAELRQMSNGRKGWYVEGYMLKGDGNTRADRIWELANSLQKTDRKLGFSVEGKILERDPNNPKIVRKAVVTEVAITKCPVNTSTSLSILAKSLSTASGSGAAIIPESLEHDEDDEDEEEKKKKGPPRTRKLKKSEAIAFLRTLNPGLTTEAAAEIVNYTVRHHPVG